MSAVQDGLNTSLTPIKRGQPLTASEEGSTAGDVEDEEQDEPEEEPLATHVLNTKHFSRNQRLLDDKTVEASARRSLRLSPDRKKTFDPSKIKSSSKRSCSGQDIAPKAPNVTARKETAKQSGSKKVPVKSLSAMERYQLTKKAPKVNISNRENVSVVDTDPDTSGVSAKSVLPRKQVVKAPGAYMKKPTAVPKAPAKASTSRAKPTAEDLTSMDDDSIDEFGVELPWYEKQGPRYRKLREDKASAKRRKAAEDDKLVKVMQDKAETMRHLTQAVDKMATNAPGNAQGAREAPTTAEQLWADSLVPHLMRMTQVKRDFYMVHVLSLAFKAISGTWPPEK